MRLVKKKWRRATYFCWSLVEKVYNEQIIYFMTRYTKTRTCYHGRPVRGNAPSVNKMASRGRCKKLGPKVCCLI